MLLAASLAVTLPGDAQTPAPAAQDSFMLTIFLRHDQTKTLDQLQQHLKETGFDQSFPPEGIEIVSWYVMMGVGQVVTLRVPPARLRDVNRVIEVAITKASPIVTAMRARKISTTLQKPQRA